MTAPHASHPARQRGYGLVEMLVAFTVMSIVIAVSFMALTRSQSQTASVTSVAEERQMARTAIQLLEREARMAGSGWGRNTVYTGGGVSLQAVNPQYGGAARNDSLILLGAWQASTTTTTAVASENSNIACVSVSGINVGDLQNTRGTLVPCRGAEAADKELKDMKRLLDVNYLTEGK